MRTVLTLLLAAMLVGCGSAGRGHALAVGDPPAPAVVITFTPSTVSFGSVTVGSAATQPVTAKNTGDATIAISQPTIGGSADFTAANFTGGDLAPGNSTAFDIVYQPKAIGSATAILNLANFDLPLSGNGVHPRRVSEWGVVRVDSSNHEVNHLFTITNTGGTALGHGRAEREGGAVRRVQDR